jgi:hypothetical protein
MTPAERTRPISRRRKQAGAARTAKRREPVPTPSRGAARNLTSRPDDPLPTFIREELAKRDLLQADAAARAGLSTATLSFWTRGVKVPSVRNITAFAEMLAAVDGRPEDQAWIEHVRNVMLRLANHIPEGSPPPTAALPERLRSHPRFASLMSTLAQAPDDATIDEALEMVNLILDRWLRRRPQAHAPAGAAVVESADAAGAHR